MTLKSLLKFMFTERLGFKRPPAVTPEDERVKEHYLERQRELDEVFESAVLSLDVTRELWSLKRGRK
jgi:hypothetical protein